MAVSGEVDDRLEGHRAAWERKPVLRAVYEHYYRRILHNCVEGRSLEIGGGPGNLKSHIPGLLSVDILPTSWLDARTDAECLPFASRSFDNLILVDVLHHLESPATFFSEAQRVLRNRGRIVMVEPGITPLSYPFWKLFHHEPVRMLVDPLAPAPEKAPRDPFSDSNQAIPTLLFGRYRRAFEHRFPGLTVLRVEPMSLIAYPLSGGFQRWSLLPPRAVRPLLAAEDRLERLLGPMMGFRLVVVLERQEAD